MPKIINSLERFSRLPRVWEEIIKEMNIPQNFAFNNGRTTSQILIYSKLILRAIELFKVDRYI